MASEEGKTLKISYDHESVTITAGEQQMKIPFSSWIQITDCIREDMRYRLGEQGKLDA